MSEPSTAERENAYRSALATVRALVANDQVAVHTIAKHADPAGNLLTDIAGISLYLLTANVAEPLRVIDALFARVPETLARAAEERRQDGPGDGDEAAR